MSYRHKGAHQLLTLIAGLLLATALFVPAGPAQVRAAPADHLICLSPGHGGSDTGAAYWGLQEKDLNVDIALRLESLLLNAGYRVVLTHRDPSVELDSRARAQICNDAGADTVLWIHLNASSDPSVDYFQAFWGKKNKDLRFCQMLTEHYQLSAPDGNGLLPTRSVGQFASGVLLWTQAPACLVETVFLSNPAEGQLLGDGTGARQQAIAQELFDGLVAWYAGR